MTEYVTPILEAPTNAAIPDDPSNWYRIAANVFGLAFGAVERIRMSATDFILACGRLVLTGTITAGGNTANAVQIGTAGPLVYSGSGAPTISAAVKGSLYLRTDGTTTNDRMYVATNNSGTWTAVTTAA